MLNNSLINRSSLWCILSTVAWTKLHCSVTFKAQKILFSIAFSAEEKSVCICVIIWRLSLCCLRIRLLGDSLCQAAIFILYLGLTYFLSLFLPPWCTEISRGGDRLTAGRGEGVWNLEDLLQGSIWQNVGCYPVETSFRSLNPGRRMLDN